MSYQVEISSLEDYALINLRGEAQVITNWEAALDVTFPKAAHTAVIEREVSVLSLAPDHWWVRTALKNEEELFRMLSQAVSGEHAAVTMVTDHFQGFSLQGADAVAVLRQGFSLDLRLLDSGQCTRGGFARCGATLQVVESGTDYELFVESSYSEYVECWLKVAKGDTV
tara:strand:+ start:216 stop:722 length:507 start_codon:yes stop_codon:yes gene_type:complete